MRRLGKEYGIGGYGDNALKLVTGLIGGEKEVVHAVGALMCCRSTYHWFYATLNFSMAKNGHNRAPRLAIRRLKGGTKSRSLIIRDPEISHTIFLLNCVLLIS